MSISNPSALNQAFIHPWQLKTGNYIASAGERILADTSVASWILKFPENPLPGQEIEIYGVRGLLNNPLKIDLNGAKFRANPSNIELTHDVYLKFVFVNSFIGWIANSQNLAVYPLAVNGLMDAVPPIKSVLPPPPPLIITTQSFFSDAPNPTTETTDNTKYHIGTQFKCTTPGDIIALRMWKNLNDTSTSCLLNLWDVSTSAIIAEVQGNYAANFRGWIEAPLPVPVSIVTTKEYIVSSQSLYYALNSQGMSSNGTHVRDQLVALKAVFNTFPAIPNKNVSPTNNYYRDVVFRYSK